MSRGSGGRWSVEVRVVPKLGVNDPEGDAILGGLRDLGYGGLESLRAGKLFQLVVWAPDAELAGEIATDACERLLANPVIERYVVDVLGPDGEGG